MYKITIKYYGSERTEEFKTEKSAWKEYSELYAHFLDVGNAEMIMYKEDKIIFKDYFS